MRRMSANKMSASPLQRADRMPRALLVEDDGATRAVTTTLLQNLGYRVDAVCDGYAAVEAVGNTSYDVVLMDLLLPGLNGPDAVRAIHRGTPQGKLPAMIAMTGNLSKADRKAWAAAGMSVFIGKPATRQKIAAALRQAAAEHRPDCMKYRPLPSDALDAQQVASIRASLGDEADSIISLFLRETADRLARMKGLSGADQRRALNREAHSLKSAAATFGCSKLAQLSRALEDEAATLDATRVPARVAELSDAYAIAKKALIGDAE